MKRDPDGTLYVIQAKDEADKNHNEDDTEATNVAKMYQKKGSVLCPVKSYELYISRLDPNCDKLWQKPMPFVDWNTQQWYGGGSNNKGIGKNPLGEFMATLSTRANLQNRYTNHSVRATCITVLDGKGFEARDIMTVSSHKTEQTIKSYSRTSDTRKREMSNALSTALVQSPPEKKSKKEPIETTTKLQNDDENLSTIRDLLQLTPDQETEFFNEIFSQDIPIPENKTTPPQVNAQGNSLSISTNNNVQNMPLNARLIPKMLFSNSNVTINFNIK